MGVNPIGANSTNVYAFGNTPKLYQEKENTPSLDTFLKTKGDSISLSNTNNTTDPTSLAAAQTQKPKGTSKSNDGMFSISEALKNLGKGVGKFFTDTWKGIKEHPIKSLLVVGLAVGFCALTGPVGVAILAGAGLVSGAFAAGGGVISAITKYATGDKDGAEQAFTDIGKGLTEAGLSFVAGSSALKAINIGTKAGAVAGAAEAGTEAAEAGAAAAGAAEKAGFMSKIFRGVGKEDMSKQGLGKIFKLGFDGDWAIIKDTIKQPFKTINKFRNPNRAVKTGLITRMKVASKLRKQNPDLGFFDSIKQAKASDLMARTKTRIQAQRAENHINFNDYEGTGFFQKVGNIAKDEGISYVKSIETDIRKIGLKRPNSKTKWTDAEYEALRNFKVDFEKFNQLKNLNFFNGLSAGESTVVVMDKING